MQYLCQLKEIADRGFLSARRLLIHCFNCTDFNIASVPEKHRNAPNTGKGNKRVDNSAHDCILSAAYPAYNVKLEKTD